jgi:probable phosphoglycerate mutase
VELLLIRHALPRRVELTEGPADPGLAADGRAQTERLVGYLASEPLDAVYASPLRRAHETAAPLARAQGLDVVPVAGVAEWDQDRPDYVPVEELKAADDPRWQALLDGTWTATESAAEFRDRVRDTVEALVSAHRGDRVAVVCHGGVINAYLAHVLGLTTPNHAFFYPNYTSIHRVAAASTGERSIVTVNETSHLRGTGLPMGLFQTG